MDEYISREFVLSCVDSFLSKTDMPIAAQYFYDCFRECEASDVQPAKSGHWINDGDCLICSYCHTAYSSWFRGSNYCAECGADMRGEEQ